MAKTQTLSESLSIGKPSSISTNWMVVILWFVSGTWIFCYKLYFINQQEWFSGGAILGQIIFALTSSVISSGIFYYFVVYRDKKRIKKIVYPMVKMQLLNVAVFVPSILRALNAIVPFESSGLPDEQTFNKMFSGVLINDRPPRFSVSQDDFNTWREFFHTQFNNIRFRSQLLYNNSSHLTPTLLQKLSQVQYSDFEMSLNNTVDWPEASLGNPAAGLWQFLKDLQELAGKDLKGLE